MLLENTLYMNLAIQLVPLRNYRSTQNKQFQVQDSIHYHPISTETQIIEMPEKLTQRPLSLPSRRLDDDHMSYILDPRCNV
jgi:hypothetical protein